MRKSQFSNTKEDHFERIIILLSGPVAVGKSSVSSVLENQHNFIPLKSSTFLVRKALSLGLEITRANLQNLGDKLDNETDYEWVVSEVVQPAVRSIPEHRLWLFDSVRKERQVGYFHNQFGHGSIYHIHLTANEEVIKSRFLSRDSSLTLDDYALTISHPNEKSSRNLSRIANEIIDVQHKPSETVASEIIDMVAVKLKE